MSNDSNSGIAADTCPDCHHPLADNNHGPDQNDLYFDDAGNLHHTGTCTYCKVCNPASPVTADTVPVPSPEPGRWQIVDKDGLYVSPNEYYTAEELVKAIEYWNAARPELAPFRQAGTPKVETGKE